jgi:hypothetical protein
VWDEHRTPLDPDDLPISADLRAMLGEWMGIYWTARKPMTTAQLEDFSLKGLIVARAFKTELPSWEIVYFDLAAADRALDEEGGDVEGADPFDYEILDILPDWQHRHALT